jgi:antitoxin component YwqK of YwqJK toxin-antitoxin module
MRRKSETNFLYTNFDNKINELKVKSSDENDTTIIKFNQMGKITSITSSASNIENEVLLFHENGKLKSKITYKNYLKNGSAYYFYKSGYLSGQYEFLSDKLFNYGMDFWDTTTIQKTIYHYDRLNGKYFKRKDFDRLGNEMLGSQ